MAEGLLLLEPACILFLPEPEAVGLVLGYGANAVKVFSGEGCRRRGAGLGVAGATGVESEPEAIGMSSFGASRTTRMERARS